MQCMNVLWRHNGFGMTFAEMDDLNQRIDVQALHDYSLAVHSRTLEIVNQIEMDSLENVVEATHLRKVLFDEGLAIERTYG
jgi:hypothetical protein